MKNIIPVIVALLALLTVILISSCARSAKGIARTDNPDIDVELLFEKDGIKVYRFYDYGSARYFTDARGSVEWREQQGKTSVRKSIETVE
jgi:hypothetical protein